MPQRRSLFDLLDAELAHVDDWCVSNDAAVIRDWQRQARDLQIRDARGARLHAGSPAAKKWLDSSRRFLSSPLFADLKTGSLSVWARRIGDSGLQVGPPEKLPRQVWQGGAFVLTRRSGQIAIHADSGAWICVTEPEVIVDEPEEGEQNELVPPGAPPKDTVALRRRATEWLKRQIRAGSQVTRKATVQQMCTEHPGLSERGALKIWSAVSAESPEFGLSRRGRRKSKRSTNNRST